MAFGRIGDAEQIECLGVAAGDLQHRGVGEAEIDPLRRVQLRIGIRARDRGKIGAVLPERLEIAERDPRRCRFVVLVQHRTQCGFGFGQASERLQAFRAQDARWMMARVVAQGGVECGARTCGIARQFQCAAEVVPGIEQARIEAYRQAERGHRSRFLTGQRERGTEVVGDAGILRAQLAHLIEQRDRGLQIAAPLLQQTA